ncbi:MAG: class I SAM-dependent methyltransferase [Leptolyngbyaceae cyanobacterium CSU_1_4]|nr:class I SAM-dependent methyltransferase [Leptolyngbyaceae cyanobacterium CSU_1_4]
MLSGKEQLKAMRTDQYETKDFEIYTHNDRAEMLAYIPQNAAIVLDVGCALGSFGQRLKAERATEVWGVEINEYAASIASKVLDRVFCEAFDETLSLPQNKFDCIIFNDVLEHFVDPYSALLYAKKLLKKDGKIVVSIPNVRYFDNIWNLLIKKDWQYTEQGILDRTHLRFFTRKSMVRTLETLGYSVNQVQGIGLLEIAHPHRFNKFRFLNFIFFNQIEDMRYLQFAIVASL